MKTVMALICFVCVGLSLGGDNAGESVSQPSNFEFARHLEEQRDYYRAVGEYQRVLFVTGDVALKRRCHLGIARCYLLGRKWTALEVACKNALELEGYTSQEAAALNTALAAALWNLGRPRAAYEWLEKTQATGEVAKRLKAWTAYASGEPNSDVLFEAAGDIRLAELVREGEPQEKSPFLAGTLSALLPGAGQLYMDKPKAALGALVVNAILIGSAIEAFDEDHEVLGTGLGLLALGFYSGNIYGAVNFAHQHNREIGQERDISLARRDHRNDKFKQQVVIGLKIPF